MFEDTSKNICEGNENCVHQKKGLKTQSMQRKNFNKITPKGAQHLKNCVKRNFLNKETEKPHLEVNASQV